VKSNYNDKVEKDEMMGRACNTHGREWNVYSRTNITSVGKSAGKLTLDQDASERIVLK
jgi:hypothetical protein